MTCTMFYIFEHHGPDTTEYLFTTTEWFSSNFDSLQQLCEIGLDDTHKEPIAYGGPRIDEDPLFADCRFLFQTDNLETAHLDYPEWFV